MSGICLFDHACPDGYVSQLQVVGNKFQLHTESVWLHSSPLAQCVARRAPSYAAMRMVAGSNPVLVIA